MVHIKACKECRTFLSPCTMLAILVLMRPSLQFKNLPKANMKSLHPSMETPNVAVSILPILSARLRSRPCSGNLRLRRAVAAKPSRILQISDSARIFNLKEGVELRRGIGGEGLGFLVGNDT